jgi:hypothetical protein
MQIGPEDAAIDVPDRMEQVMMVAPVDANKNTTIRLKARIDFSLSVLNMLWWVLGVNHRPT